MRRLLLVNALIFAVLAAAAALAYYGYAATSVETSRDRELALMQDLAEEKVLNIEFLIDDADKKLMREIDLDELPRLQKKVETSGAGVVSVIVLDEQLNLVPSGSVSTQPEKQAKEFRDWLLANVLPQLPLARTPLNERGHLYLNLDRPYLFSFMRRVSEGRTFYIVIEDDLFHLVRLCEQFFFISDESKRLYQVVDDRGGLRCGPPFRDIGEGLVVERRFASTWDGFVLRVAQKDIGDLDLLRKKRMINSVLIGGAVTVILGGLLVLGFAIRRERRLSALKSEFISNVSHELKTPLSIISMFGEMLAQGRTKSPEQAHEYAEIIWRESVRLGRLIDNVLDFAKIERGADMYEFEDDVDLREVVERAIDLAARRVAGAEMTLTSTLDEDLPPVRLDANAFTLAVLNLIDNAVKYAAEGKRIELSLARRDDRLVLSVRDWGPGIAPDEHAHVFERFYRARAIRLKPIRGSGIGLALVQHIARAHGGDAEVESAPGRGSTFSIWLPIGGKS
ncbi:MAG TPA: HAMP domain-containing sensor histidine kinase [Kofleriaceae bacterium]|nr:HAMP domain-containing sensor histidine kinase [Kofleriaceae bacterium]